LTWINVAAVPADHYSCADGLVKRGADLLNRLVSG